MPRPRQPAGSGRINIRPWPVFGMYQPDTIASYRVEGRDYFVTVNEGDARDWTGFAEEARVSALTLDPVAFPDGATLKASANLGRHTVTRALGDVDGDGDHDALYTLGGRSFTIWSDKGKLVYDSGSSLERITSIAIPSLFNAGHDDPAFDSRSDNKGGTRGTGTGPARGRTTPSSGWSVSAASLPSTSRGRRRRCSRST
jgi:hypothetical protein